MSSRWQQEALLPMNRMAESVGIFAAVTIPMRNGSRLARFNGGLFDSPSDERTERFR